MSSTNPSVAIVGGGISGLTLGLTLLDEAKRRKIAAPEITVLEAADRPGGKIRSTREDEFLCEWGPNGFLDKEPKTLELCERLGLTPMPAEDAFSNRYIFRKGKLRKVSMNPVKFMASPLLPWSAKFRLAVEPFIRSPKQWPDDETVADFARRRIGSTAFRLLIDPMQSGIYAGDPERMSVRSCFPRVAEVEREYGSLIRGMAKLARKRRAEGKSVNAGAGPSGHLTSMQEGISTLTDALAKELGPRVVTNAAITEVQMSESGYRLRTKSGATFHADVVVLSCPAFAAAEQLRKLAPDAAQLLGEIEYSPLTVVSLGYRREQVAHPLDGFGFLAPRGEGLRLLGSLFTSSIFRHRAPDGHVLIRVMVGGARDPGILQLDKGQMVQLAAQELGPVLGLEGDPAFCRVFPHEHAIPQYNVGHARRLADIEGKLQKSAPGVLLTGNAYRGIGINDCVKSAGPIAEEVFACLS